MYGNLADLPDEELADPTMSWIRVLCTSRCGGLFCSLPQQRWECPIRPNMDEDGKVNWGAFGTVGL